MKDIAKAQVNKVLMLLKMTLITNGLGLATDHEGHLLIFESAEYKEKGQRLEDCDGMVIHLEDLVR